MHKACSIQNIVKTVLDKKVLCKNQFITDYSDVKYLKTCRFLYKMFITEVVVFSGTSQFQPAIISNSHTIPTGSNPKTAYRQRVTV